MEMRQLEYFVAVAEEGGFTRAACRVHISQSGVSAQLRRLERELGAELIDRSGRTATLTAAGRAAIEPARAALAGAAGVREAVDAINGMLRGELALGMVTGCEIAPLFDGIAQFGAAHPGVAMQLVEGSADQLAADVRSGALDAALLGTAERELPGLESATIVSEELAVAVAPGHPLLECDPLTLADVVAHPVICLPTGTGIRTVLDLACGARGLAAAVALQASAPGAVADLAARGLGVAVLTASMLAGRDGLRVRPIADTGERALLALVWRPDPGPAVSELIERCRAAFGAARQPG